MATDADDDAMVAALQAGAHGLLTKDASREELLHAIQIVAHGGAAFSAPVAERIGTHFSRLTQASGRVAFPELTDREIEVLGLIAAGHNNRRIARHLVLSEKTVRNHITSIFSKLRVSDRSSAIMRARDAGLGIPGNEHFSSLL